MRHPTVLEAEAELSSDRHHTRDHFETPVNHKVPAHPEEWMDEFISEDDLKTKPVSCFSHHHRVWSIEEIEDLMEAI
jgi:hypothetical protein